MSRRTVLSLSLVAATAALAVPAVAHADPPEAHGTFDETFENVDVCGINVDIRVRGSFTDHVYFDNEGNFDHFKNTSSVKQTLTADNGKSVVIQNAGQFTDTEGVVDEAAGTITFVFSYKGLPEKIRTPHGPVIVRDAGLITFADTFDLETGDFISEEILVNNGPHPEADSGFELFCEAIIAALS